MVNAMTMLFGMFFFYDLEHLDNHNFRKLF